MTNPDKSQSECSRRKYWHEKSDGEKIEQLGESLDYLCKQFLEIGQIVHRLRGHRHGMLDETVISLNHKEAAEPWILRNPLNKPEAGTK